MGQILGGEGGYICQCGCHYEGMGGFWDDIIKILKGHWLSPIIADSKSKSRISLNAFFRFFPGQFLPVSHAEIKWDDFSLSSKNPANAPLKIDRNYLINIMDKKLKIVHNGQYLPFEKIPWELIDAIICSEDPRYWSHSGFCLYGLGIALRENIKTRKFSRGASTITMQVVRNIFLTHNRNLVRKVEESILALLLENYYKIEKKNHFGTLSEPNRVRSERIWCTKRHSVLFRQRTQ